MTFITVNMTVIAVFMMYHLFFKVLMGFFINQYQEFKGNIQELVNLATNCSSYLNLPGDVEKINERTIRYYVTEGLVDKPLRIGRDAEYGYRHLMQFLASRYLVGEGYPMAKVAPYISSKKLDELENFLTNPVKPNLAELLIASFTKGEDFKKNKVIRPRSGQPYSINTLTATDLSASYGSKVQRNNSHELDYRCQEELGKIRDEMYQMRMEFRSDMKDLQMQSSQDREKLQKKIDELTQLLKMQNK